MVAAIFYHPDGYETSRDKLMGRHAAGEGMLKALCRHADSDTLHAYCADKKHFDHFTQKVSKFSPAPKTCSWIHPSNWQKLKEPGCIFMAGPVLSDLAWLRRHGESRDFSICGVTHTTATDRAMDAIGNLITAPLQPWDALVCTSQSVRTMVQRIMLDYQNYLCDRFGVTAAKCLPIELPVIPLGVDFSEFDISDEKKLAYRKSWREKLGISDGEPAVLYVGRFSFNDKAHPVPMYMALEQCGQILKKQVTLVMAGWFQTDAIKNEFVEAAKLFCPSVKVIFVDGRHAAVRKTIWYAADVFTSLVDNVQETFGLTPIEAMAAGLPAVVSDWDGYKETVRDGIDGFRIPTWTAPPGLGSGIALAYASGADSYGHYVGYQCQFTAVDVFQSAAAFARLLSDPALRKQMGEAGRERVRTTFDWKIVIKQYEELWKQQDELRRSGAQIGSTKPAYPASPLRNDPFALFSHYPTWLLSPDTLVAKSLAANKKRLAHLGKSRIAAFGTQFAYPGEKLAQLLDGLPQDQLVTVQDLCLQVPAADGRSLLFSLLWLSKNGMIRLLPAEAAKQDEKTTEPAATQSLSR